MTKRWNFDIGWHETQSNENLAHSFDSLLQTQKHFLCWPESCLSGKPVYDCSIKIRKWVKISTKFTASIYKEVLVAKIIVSFWQHLQVVCNLLRQPTGNRSIRWSAFSLVFCGTFSFVFLGLLFQVQQKFRCYLFASCIHWDCVPCAKVLLGLPSSCWPWRSHVQYPIGGANRLLASLKWAIKVENQSTGKDCSPSIYHDFEENINKNIPSSQM